MNFLFATMVVERPPLTWGDFPSALFSWMSVVGGLAAFALAFWVVADLLRRAFGYPPPAINTTGWSWKSPIFVLLLFLALLAYIAYGGLKLREAMRSIPGADTTTLTTQRTPADWVGLAGAVCALVAVAFPFLQGL